MLFIDLPLLIPILYFGNRDLKNTFARFPSHSHLTTIIVKGNEVNQSNKQINKPKTKQNLS